tara:strand:- start:157 stop:492 length:336 start_codon:yes stop_codon:yes gene_type:complete
MLENVREISYYLFLILCLALPAWRVSSLLRFEDGPFEILFKFRKLIKINEDKYPQNMITGIFTCTACFSVWLGFASWGLVLIPLEYLLPFIIIGNAASIYILLEDKVFKNG